MREIPDLTPDDGLDEGDPWTIEVQPIDEDGLVQEPSDIDCKIGNSNAATETLAIGAFTRVTGVNGTYLRHEYEHTLEAGDTFFTISSTAPVKGTDQYKVYARPKQVQ